MVELNMDGSKKANGTSGGGVIRDDHGDLVYEFNHQYNHSEVIHAELQAIIDGLIYIQILVLENVVIETDSAVTFQMIQQAKHEQWSCTYLLRQIWSLKLASHEMSFVFPEQNRERMQLPSWRTLFRLILSFIDLRAFL